MLFRSRLAQRAAVVCAKAAKDEDSVYRLYYEFKQPLSKVQGYQTLAINRGEREEFLKVSLELDRNEALREVCRGTVKENGKSSECVRLAAEDGYDRLIFPSLEREMRALLSENASDGAISTFALNLRPLLMQPPVKGKVKIGRAHV